MNGKKKKQTKAKDYLQVQKHSFLGTDNTHLPELLFRGSIFLKLPKKPLVRENGDVAADDLLFGERVGVTIPDELPRGLRGAGLGNLGGGRFLMASLFLGKPGDFSRRLLSTNTYPSESRSLLLLLLEQSSLSFPESSLLLKLAAILSLLLPSLVQFSRLPPKNVSAYGYALTTQALTSS